jgi:thiamin-phosphate kinase
MTLSHQLGALAEVRAIDALIQGFKRHPDQWNRPHEADAELVKLTQLAPDTYLAATIDCLGTELASGFYQDAYTAGWVLVMASLSDLAAVGAAPIGLLLALGLPPGDAFIARLGEGARDALAATGVAVLGGDLNEATVPMLTSCGLGLVHGKPVGRMGIQPGDELWATGRLGSGNGLAIVRLLGLPDTLWPESRFRPTARLSAGQALRLTANAMMDTSDGMLSTLDHLARLNQVGLRIDFNPTQLVDPALLAAFTLAGLPGWPLLCGEHGEYELMVAVAPGHAMEVLAAAPDAVRVAVATATPGLLLQLPDWREVIYDGSFIRNLPAQVAGDWQAYAREFQAFGTALGLP